MAHATPPNRPVAFVDAVRSPFGKAKPDGLYAHTRADDIAVTILRDLLRRHPSLNPELIDDVAIAATTQSGDQGLTLGRTVGLLAGLPQQVPGFAIDRLCAGAMTAVTTTASTIAAGFADITIAGGVEHMGHHPMGFDADPNPRFVAERIVSPDALNMGVTAENLHDRFPHLTKRRADEYAVNSQARYQAAWDAGHIQPSIVPVALRDPQRGWGLATRDELARPGTTVESIADLPTPFRAGGRVTAGNASPLTDGATMSLLAAEPVARDLNLPVAMRLVTFAYAGVEPEIMGYGPVPSTLKALARAGLTMDDIGLIEINEAFAVQVLAFLDHFGIKDDDPRVNPYGGAIAMGHPLAASGVRLMSQLASLFAANPDVRYGMTTMCIGLGMGATVIWENGTFTATENEATR
ncbi:thiolase family protein [Jonesia quinghaiensis]|uniref:thiolase family protein n=1 Tax=Jonesia quinghaiensis TaxID=262806 RepID=UPI00040EF467|nr:thiolase family protein [Jonesia quinghaiensis]